MKFDLKAPCKNCPFRNDKTRITFACKERAEEIEEMAYRNGFPCHLSAVLDEDKEDAGFEPGPNTQHCAGAIIMYLNQGDGAWPGIDNDEDLHTKLARQMKPDYWKQPVFESPDEFIAANDEPRPKRKLRKKE